jgi:ABC-type sulfate transport system permease subunit
MLTNHTLQALDCLGYGQLTSLGTAVAVSSVTGGIPAGTETVVLQAEAQDVRYRDDNTAPAAGVGMILAAKVINEFTVAQFSQMKVIEATATAKLNISFYGKKSVPNNLGF